MVLADIENGLIELVRASMIAKFLRVVDSMPDLDDETLLKRFVLDAPAVYVAPAARFPIRDRILQPTFTVACIARNAAGQSATRKGDGRAIGLYDMLMMVSAVLDGAKPGGVAMYALSADMMQDQKIYNQGLQIAVITLSGQLELGNGIDFDALDDFEIFGSQYDLPPHENAEQRQKWLSEPPDHSESQPELADVTTINP